MHRQMSCIAPFTLLLILVLSSIAIAADTTQTEYATVLKPTVNLRAGHDTGTRVLTAVHRGDEFTVVGQTENWVNIEHPQFGSGWIYRPLVALRTDTIIIPQASTISTGNAYLHAKETVTTNQLALLVVGLCLFGAVVSVIYLACRGSQNQLFHHFR